MSTGGMRARDVRLSPAGLEALLEVAALALRGDAPRAELLLCRAACVWTGAAKASLELRTSAGARQLARTPGQSEEPWPRGRASVEVHRVRLGSGTLRLWAPRLPLPPRDAPLFRLCSAVLAREAEAEAERAWRQAQRLERSLATQRLELAGRQRRRTVHDLRAPLVVIKGYTDMLLRGLAGPLSPDVIRYLERMASAAEQQRALLEDTFPKPRMAPREPRTLAQWLDAFLGTLRLWASRRKLVLSMAGAAADCPLEGSSQALSALRRAWLRAIGGSAGVGSRVSLSVVAADGAWEVASCVEVGAGRCLRRWQVLDELARREGLALQVSPGALTRVRWTVGVQGAEAEPV